MRDDRPVVVLGAGLAGLVAARELSRNGVQTLIFEAKRDVAARVAARDEDGFSFAPFGHVITQRLADALGMGALCRAVKRYGEGVYLKGKHHSLPMGLLGAPRFLISALNDRTQIRLGRPRDVREWFTQRYGAALAEEMAAPLLEAWTGVSAEQLAPALGRVIPAGFRRRLLTSLASELTGRSVSPRPPSGFHVYPEGGVHSIVERLLLGLGARVELESPVTKIFVEKGRVVALRVAGKEVGVRALVSTLPINRLAELVVGSERLERFKAFRFRSGIVVQLKLDGVHVMPDVVTWVPRGTPFFRITESPQSMPWLAPQGKSSLLVEYGVALGDWLWNRSDGELAEHTLAHLEPLLPDVRHRFRGVHVQRSALAYPMFLREYEPARAGLARGTGIEGLLSVGRKGEFDHGALEDVYWRTVERVRQLVPKLER